MSLAPRDAEAFNLARAVNYDGAYLTSLELDMQARRLIVEVYGTLHGAATARASITFYGATRFEVENENGAFPASVQLSSLQLTENDDDGGDAELSGVRDWTMRWSFDGMAYDESPAVRASFIDDADSDDG